MTWTCAAIDHGVTIFPSGKIGPCCQVSAEYLKPISEVTNPNRFVDLKTQVAPQACNKCSVDEYHGLNSYRNWFNKSKTPAPGIQFVDIRNTNICNLKCRYCGPHFSSKWAEELNIFPIIKTQDLTNYKQTLITDSLHHMYFTGGEPLINGDHWKLLEELIDQGRSKQISLMYNSNLTTIKYKDKNIIDIWQQFKNIDINCSIDAIGKPLENIRSGTSWKKIKSNLEQLLTKSANLNINISFSPVLSILNIWFIDDLYKYASEINIPVNLIVLTGPDYLALDVIPNSLKELALDKINNLNTKYNIDNNTILHLKNLVNNNINQCLLRQTISHILLLDNLRNEKLFDLLPFKSFSIDNILKNNEYE